MASQQKTTGTMPRVLVFGSANMDTFVYLDALPRPGETVFGHGGSSGLGGKGANQAVAAEKLGVQVDLIGRLGTDEAGNTLRRLLASQGVGTSGMLASATSRTGTAQVTVDGSGENTVVVVSGANAEVGPEALEAHEVAAALRDVATTVGLAQGELPAHAVAAFALVCRDHSIRFVLNLAPVIDVPLATLSAADPLILNEGEALELHRRLAPDTAVAPGSGSAVDDVGRLAADLADKFAASVVITLGERGAIASAGEATWHQPAPQSGKVVDTTGAGDAFVGAVAARLAHGDDLRAAVRWGTAAGSLAVTTPGTSDSYRGLAALEVDENGTPNPRVLCLDDQVVA
ncbi:ribokinase [Brachybacterium vulturis]|uniref:Ribokinase n=1 Tax=Brachybacterium vulturis TaxID=2017484 RepID=A0A291GR96_9MICO|nr:ribokinase [Brachybacterium vulturis]ATG53003.1 ribokinase [Brachybacterium vulturis]